MNYAVDIEAGNVFQQQLAEYFSSHGRLLTHVFVRIILQNRIIADFLMAWMALFFLWTASLLSDPEVDGFPSHTPLLWISLVIFFPFGMWIPMVQVAHFMSYRFTFALIALFLLPYLRLFSRTSSQASLWWVLVQGF